MAKVYSWEISQNPKKYAYIVSPKDTTKVYIGNELKGDNLEKVKEWTATCTDEEYKEQFEQMVNLCNSSGYNVKFETFTNYIGVDASCNNLRGPAGKGIEHIALQSIDITRNVSCYVIYYDDGTTDTFEIQNGKDGRDGNDGQPGAKGDAGVSSKFVMVYASGVDEYGNILPPSRPDGGSYDFIKNEMTYPLGWSPNDTTLTPPVWMSSRTFSSSDASTDKQWSLPVQITGDAGAPGKDGSVTEFIYCLDDNKPSVENLESKNESGYFPPDSGWTPSPTGVSETHLTEWCSMRKLNRETNIWGPWEPPFIWSKYGVNGQDGDGVQYIYLKNRGEVPLNPTPYDFATNKDYQNRDVEWVPKKDEKYINKYGETVVFSAIENVTDESKVPAGVWTDNPSDVTADYHSQWVSTRKYRKNSDGVMVWEAYSNPALWAKFGQDGKSATTIRKLYALSPSTQERPNLPTSSTITGDWGTGFPKDYKSGENVVWCTEAELWANNFEFVKSYQLVSTKDEENNIIPPKDYEDNYIDVSEIPSEEVPTFKYVRFNGEYYEWIAQSWCEPYIVTGLKGEPGSPVDYTTYVFAFAYTNHTPNPPEGESSKTPGNSTDDLGNIIKWVDYPKSDENGYGVDGYVDENGNEMRWYQCIGYVDGHDGHIKNWGDVCPCNGRDGSNGAVGKYVEIRFGVTKNSIKPSFEEYEIIYDEKGDVEFYKPYREPLLKDDAGNIVGWFASDEKLPDLTDGGVLWQIWALIDGETNEVIEQNGHAWNGPIRVSGEKGEQGVQGPAGMRGVTGIPGAKALNMYCLGTYGGKNSNSENYWETGGVHGGDGYFGSKNWLSGATPKDMTDWYLSNEMPYADVIEVSSAEEAKTVAKAINNNDGTLANRGRVIKLIDVTTSDVFHTYFLVTHKGELRELTQPLSVEKSEDFNVYVWCIQGNEVWKSGPYEKYVDITRYDDDGDVIPPEDADNNNTKPKNELPTEKDEFCKYVYYNSKYYEWKEIDGDKVQHVLEKIEWGSPFKLQGTNGLRGLPGSRGQVVYPMGIYNHEEVYITTEDKAPYVYDPTDGMYYVYNIVGEPWVGRLPGYNEETGEYDESVYKNIRDNDGTFKYSIDGTGNDNTWMGDQDGDTPANNYANKTNNNEKPAWVRFESFQALYTSIGIIENGMIGSAVYNNEFMFSQQGIDPDGNPTTYAIISGQNTDYGFLSGYEYDEKGEYNSEGNPTGNHWRYKGSVDAYIPEKKVDPYEVKNDTNAQYFQNIPKNKPIHAFRPNVCINFATGQMWLSAGKFRFGVTSDDINVKTSEDIKSDIEKVQAEFKAADAEIMGSVKTLSGDIDSKFKEITNKFVANDKLAGLFSTLVTENGLVTQAEISTSIQEGIATATIKADKVNIGGNVNINDILTVDNNMVSMSNATIEDCHIEDCTITNVTIEGSLRSPFVLDDNTGTVDSTLHDNIVCHMVDSNATAANQAVAYPYALQWDKSQNGRKVTIANGLWEHATNGTEESVGIIRINAPTTENIKVNFENTTWGSIQDTITNLPEGLKSGEYKAYTIRRNPDSDASFNFWLNQTAYIKIPPGVKTYTFYARRLLATTANNPLPKQAVNNSYTGTVIDRPVINTGEILPIQPVPGTDCDSLTITLPNGKTKTAAQSEYWTKIEVTVLDQKVGCTVTVTHARSAATTYNTSTAQIIVPDLINTGCFFEDGIQKDHIILSREIVELTGFGCPDKFYGWVVTNRTLLNPKLNYGYPTKALLSGTVRYVYDSGSKKYVARPSLSSPYARYNSDGVIIGSGLQEYSDGKYAIIMSDTQIVDWKKIFDASTTMIMVTGIGPILNSDRNGYGKNPAKACVAQRTAKYKKDSSATSGYTYNDSGNTNWPGFEIWISDDTTTNPAGFNFIIFSTLESFGILDK